MPRFISFRISILGKLHRLEIHYYPFTLFAPKESIPENATVVIDDNENYWRFAEDTAQPLYRFGHLVRKLPGIGDFVTVIDPTNEDHVALMQTEISQLSTTRLRDFMELAMEREGRVEKE